MRKLSFMLCMLVMLSCKDEFNEILPENQRSAVDIESLQDYKGLKVNHRFSNNLFSIEGNAKKSLGSKNTANEDYYYNDPERVIMIMESIIVNFPYRIDGPMTESDFIMIRNDFPLLSDQEIVNQLETIEDYYATNLELEYRNKYDEVFELVADDPIDDPGGDDPIDDPKGDDPRDDPFGDDLILIPGSGQMRTTRTTNDDYDWDKVKCALEASGYYEMSNPNGLVRTAKAMYALFRSDLYVRPYAGQAYPDLDTQDTKRDAYRHMMWNAMLANYYFTLSSKSRRLNFARDFTTAYEDCPAINFIEAKAMDLHNNQIGRDIWSANTSYVKVFGMTIGLNRPSHTLMKSRVNARSDWAKFIEVTMTGGDPAAVAEINNTVSTKAVYLKKPDVTVDLPVTFRPNTPEYRISVINYVNNRPASFLIASDYNTGIVVGDRLDIYYEFECLAEDRGNCGGPCGYDAIGGVSFNGQGTITQVTGTNEFILVPDSAGWEVGGDLNSGCDLTELEYYAIFGL